jgi:hypothetical protein
MPGRIAAVVAGAAPNLGAIDDYNRCELSLVDATIGQRSPMAMCRMTPAPMKPRAAVVIHSSGVAFVQCTLSA